MGWVNLVSLKKKYGIHDWYSLKSKHYWVYHIPIFLNNNNNQRMVYAPRVWQQMRRHLAETNKI